MKTNKEMINEVHKMAQIALGKQITIDCTKWAIKEGFLITLWLCIKQVIGKYLDL